jgi:hypothetical protein
MEVISMPYPHTWMQLWEGDISHVYILQKLSICLIMTENNCSHCRSPLINILLHIKVTNLEICIKATITHYLSF